MTTTPTRTPATVTSVPLSTPDERADFVRDRLEPIARFLHDHLDRFGDPIDQIRAALSRAGGTGEHDGGTVTVAELDGEIVGVVVTLDTHMGGYVPENLLVYIATHRERRGMGIGKALMRTAIDACEGGIALHVEPDNPAVGLYRSLGFTSKYLEMRLDR
ncbi:MAG TPA: GNAT family N-acetyltransferase [Gammaproteobacteria bacterium]|nr:GNAT family N-acetyltransferase [Gammaproteobacteria bacterium]